MRLPFWVALCLNVLVAVLRLLVIVPIRPPDLVIDQNPGQADAIVVLEGSPARTARALDLIEQGVADTLIYPGVRTWSQRTLATQTAERNLSYTLITPDDSDTRSTWDEGIGTRKLLSEHPEIRSIVLVTSEYHTARTLWTFRKALPRAVDLAIVAATEDWWSVDRVQAQMKAARDTGEPRWRPSGGATRVFREEQLKFLAYYFLYGWRVLPPLLPIPSPGT